MTEPDDVTLDVTADVRAAYDATGAAWNNGPCDASMPRPAAVLLDERAVSFDGACIAVDVGAERVRRRPN